MTIPTEPLSAEATLIVRLRAGDEDAVRQWYHYYEPKIRKLVAAKIPNRDDAAELVQEIFLACLRELVHFRADASLHTWMRTIASHKLADYYRAKYAKRVLHLVTLLEAVELPGLSAAQDQIAVVRAALQRLAPELQELLLAKYVDGKSVKQLAGELQKTTKAVESLLFRARAQFRQEYQLACTQS